MVTELRMPELLVELAPLHGHQREALTGGGGVGVEVLLPGLTLKLSSLVSSSRVQVLPAWQPRPGQLKW